MFAFLDLFQYVSCKTQTPHKPAKSPTNHPNHPQISQTPHKPAKYHTNHSLICKKSHHFFPEDIFYEPQHFPRPSHARREIGGCF